MNNSNHTQLIRQILHNCDVSDAMHAGLFTICGLALRLRDLYKWDHRKEPWQEDPPEKVLAWIGQKEALWEKISNPDYQNLNIEGHILDPFDTLSINKRLIPNDLFYGAGYAYSLKPTFFLARIISRNSIEGRTIWRLGREYARDLSPQPAFTQDDEVVLRMETARTQLWDQMIYVDNSVRPALKFALQACCGISDSSPDALRSELEDILRVQHNIYIRHEIGELADTVFDRRIWRHLLSDHAHSPVELLVRALKDMLADTDPRGTLPHIIRTQDKAGLGFYMVFCRNMTLSLFAELKAAFLGFRRIQDWKSLNEVVGVVRKKAVELSRQVLEIYFSHCNSDSHQGNDCWTEQRNQNANHIDDDSLTCSDVDGVRHLIEDIMRRYGVLG